MDSLIHSGYINDVTPSSLLQLIEHDEQSCQLEVNSEGKGTGYLFIHEGILYDATYGDLDSTDAAIEIISWNKARVKFLNAPEIIPEKLIDSEILPLIIRGAELNRAKSLPTPSTDGHLHERFLEDINSDDPDNLVPSSDDFAPPHDQKRPSPVVDIDQSKILKILTNQADFKGFIGAGLFYYDGKSIATHAEQDIGLENAGILVADELQVMSKASMNGSLDQGCMISIETETAHIYSIPLFLPGPSKTGIYDNTCYCFMLVTSIDTPIGMIKRKFHATVQALTSFVEL